MQKDYDYLLLIAGDTGDGKSRFALQLFETWYRVILKKPVTEGMISQISQDYEGWLKSFRELKEYDMNVFDESARNLDSKSFMSRISKDLNKLFNVFRCKRFFSVVILPNYFRLNKELREDRIRGLVWVYKRGQYKLFTKTGIKYLNGYNDRRVIKSMHVARPFHVCHFPDYQGVLLPQYIIQKNKGVDEVLEEVLEELTIKKEGRQTLVGRFQDEVLERRKKGEHVHAIAQDLQISVGTVHKCMSFARK